MDYDSSYKKKTTGPYKESKARNIAMQRLVNNKVKFNVLCHLTVLDR